ncbi:MAG: hypothetical protein IJZ91_01780, partial [Oscillospiraceae bacterium]|nr:hypothetical protein [Oscillospiraceae bacterium]
MVKDIVHDPIFLAQKSAPATQEDMQTAQDLLDTLEANREEQTGCSIQDIFREHGEAHFRSLETALLRYLLEQKI